MNKILMFMIYAICMPISETLLRLYENVRISKKVFGIMVLLLILIPFCNAALNSKIEAAYFLDGSDFSDATGTHSAVTNSGTTNSIYGIINDGRSFSTSVDTLTTDFKISGSQSMSFWINITDDDTFQDINGGYAGDTSLWKCSWDVRGSTNALTCRLYISGSSYAIAATGETIGEWSHIVLSFNESSHEYKFWFNGVLQGTQATSGNLVLNNNYRFGTAGSVDQDFNGVMDEINIFNDALIPSEVSELYNSSYASRFPWGPIPPTPTDTLSFTNISVNGETFVNHSYLNTSDLNWYVEVLNESTNGNVNLTVTILNSTSDVVYNETIEKTYYNIEGFNTISDSLSITLPIGFEFNNDGSKLYSISFNSNILTEYSCNNNYNLSSCSTNGNSLDVATQESLLRGFTINNDGSKVYIIGINSDTIYEYSCNNNYNLSSCSYNSNFLNINSQDSVPRDIEFNNDGSKLYLTGQVNKRIFEYSCSTNFKIDTCSVSTSILPSISGSSELLNLEWGLNGKKLLYSDSFDKIYEYSCVDNYEILSCSNINSKTLKGGEIEFNNDGSKLYLSKRNDNKIYSYNYDLNTFNFNISLPDGQYFPTFYAFNNEANVTETGKHFHIDTSPTVLTFNNLTEFNTYAINLSELNILAVDTNFANMTINWDDGTSNFTTSTTFTGTKTFLTNGNHTFSITARDLANNHITVQGQLLINPYQYFYLFDLYSSTAVTNWSMNVNNDYYNTTNSTIKILTYDLNIGNNTFTINTTGYRNIIYTLEINTTSNYNLTLNTSQALLYLYIKDSETNNLITNQVNIYLSSLGVYSDTYNTTNGTIVINDISFLPSNYNIVLTSDNYSQSELNFVYNGLDDVNITAYMIKSSSTTPLLLIIRDDTLNPLSNILVYAKQYDFLNNNYILISSRTTNDVGQVYFNLDWDLKYQFILTDGTDIITKEGQYITSSPLYLEFAPDKSTISVPRELGIYSYIYFQNNTINSSQGIFGLVYNDPSNIIENVCIKVYKKVYTSLLFINESCSDLKSSTIFSDNINIDFGKSYLIRATGEYDGEDIILQEQIFIFPSSYTKETWAEGIGLFFSLALFLLLIFGGMESELHPMLLVVLALIPLFLGAIIGSLPVKIGAIITFGGLILYIIMFRRDK